MVTKSMSVDFKSDKILAVSIVPGWVATDMGGQKASLTPTECVNGIRNVMETMGEKENGLMIKWKGGVLEF